MITLQQLSDEIGADYLVDILEVFKFEAKDSYEDDDRELTEIRAFRAHMKVTGSKSVVNAATTYGQQESGQSQAKTSTKAKGKAIAKTERAQAEGKGALTAAVQQNAAATVRQRRRQGKELAQVGNREMVTAYLDESARGMEQFAQSINEASDTISAIIDDAAANYDGGDDEDFLPASGAFSLL